MKEREGGRIMISLRSHSAASTRYWHLRFAPCLLSLDGLTSQSDGSQLALLIRPLWLPTSSPETLEPPPSSPFSIRYLDDIDKGTEAPVPFAAVEIDIDMGMNCCYIYDILFDFIVTSSSNLRAVKYSMLLSRLAPSSFGELSPRSQSILS